MKREEGASQACFAAICILTMAVWFWDLDGGTMEGWNSHLTQPVEVKPMFRVETRPPEEFVQVSGTKFNWRGKNFHFVGTNCYYAAMKAAEPETKHLSMHIFDGMEEMGLNVLRTWAFREGKRPQTMQPSPGVYSEASFLGLDWVVREAGIRGIKLILTLTDYWEEYGGMQQYVEWSRSAQVVEHFYTDDWCKRWYKMYVSAVLNRVNKFTGKRYKDDPTIMAWELANEARNERDPGGLVVQQWTAEMSAYVKSIDPFHLVTTGSEGFFGTSCPSCNPAEYYANLGVATEQQHALEDIDYISAHLWPDIWLDEGLEHHNFAENWMTAQAHLGNQLNKPFVLGEFGKSPHGSQREEFFYSVLQSFLSVAQKGHSAGGILFWTLASSSYLDYGMCQLLHLLVGVVYLQTR